MPLTAAGADCQLASASLVSSRCSSGAGISSAHTMDAGASIFDELDSILTAQDQHDVDAMLHDLHGGQRAACPVLEQSTSMLTTSQHSGPALGQAAVHALGQAAVQQRPAVTTTASVSTSMDVDAVSSAPRAFRGMWMQMLLGDSVADAGDPSPVVDVVAHRDTCDAQIVDTNMGVGQDGNADGHVQLDGDADGHGHVHMDVHAAQQQAPVSSTAAHTCMVEPSPSPNGRARGAQAAALLEGSRVPLLAAASPNGSARVAQAAAPVPLLAAAVPVTGAACSSRAGCDGTASRSTRHAITLAHTAANVAPSTQQWASTHPSAAVVQSMQHVSMAATPACAVVHRQQALLDLVAWQLVAAAQCVTGAALVGALYAMPHAAVQPMAQGLRSAAPFNVLHASTNGSNPGRKGTPHRCSSCHQLLSHTGRKNHVTSEAHKHLPAQAGTRCKFPCAVCGMPMAQHPAQLCLRKDLKE